MKRSALVLSIPALALALAACQTPQAEPTVDPQAAAPTTAPTEIDPAGEAPLPETLPGEPLMVTRGKVAGDPSVWHFDPSGVFVAQVGNRWDESDDRLSVFEIDSGALVGEFKCGELEDDPCTNWPGPDDRWRSTPDRSQAAVAKKGQVTLHADGVPSGEEIATLPCEGRCQEVVALAYSPDGSQLAVARKNAPKVELWNIKGASKAQAPKKDKELKLDKSMRKKSHMELAWGESGLVALASDAGGSSDGEEGYGGYADYYDGGIEPVLSHWTDLDGKPKVIPLTVGPVTVAGETYNDGFTGVAGAAIDPQARFAWYLETDWAPRESIGERLSVHKLAHQEHTGIEWESVYIGYGMGMAAGIEGYEINSNESWRVSDSTAYFKVAHMGNDWDAATSFSFTAIRLTPEPRLWHHRESPMDAGDGVVLDVPEIDVALAGVKGGELITYTRVCFKVGDYEGNNSKTECVGTAPPTIPNCTGQEFSPNGDYVVATCGSDLAVAPRANPTKVATLGAVPSSHQVLWGESWVMVDSANGVSFYEPDRGTKLSELPSARYLQTPLAPELGRLVLREGHKLLIHDRKTMKQLASIPAEGVQFAAFSPDGKTLAWSDGKAINLVDAATGTETSRWNATKVKGMAFRADGDVLYTGTDLAVPQVAWVVSSGMADSNELPPEEIRSRLDPRYLDPSWRFHLDYDALWRIADGRVLRGLDTDNPYTENGWFTNSVPEGFAYIVASDPLAHRVLKGEEIADRVVRKNLVSDFVDGHPLPTPTWPADRALPVRK